MIILIVGGLIAIALWFACSGFGGIAMTLALIFVTGAGNWFVPFPYPENMPWEQMKWLHYEGFALAALIGFAPFLLAQYGAWRQSLRTGIKPPLSSPVQSGRDRALTRDKGGRSI